MSRYKNVCYLVCEADGYELPVGVFDLVEDIGTYLGITRRTVGVNIKNNYVTYANGMRYRTYRIDMGGDK